MSNFAADLVESALDVILSYTMFHSKVWCQRGMTEFSKEGFYLAYKLSKTCLRFNDLFEYPRLTMDYNVEFVLNHLPDFCDVFRAFICSCLLGSAVDGEHIWGYDMPLLEHDEYESDTLILVVGRNRDDHTRYLGFKMRKHSLRFVIDYHFGTYVQTRKCAIDGVEFMLGDDGNYYPVNDTRFARGTTVLIMAMHDETCRMKVKCDSLADICHLDYPKFRLDGLITMGHFVGTLICRFLTLLERRYNRKFSYNMIEWANDMLYTASPDHMSHYFSGRVVHYLGSTDLGRTEQLIFAERKLLYELVHYSLLNDKVLEVVEMAECGLSDSGFLWEFSGIVADIPEALRLEFDRLYTDTQPYQIPLELHHYLDFDDEHFGNDNPFNEWDLREPD